MKVTVVRGAALFLSVALASGVALSACTDEDPTLDGQALGEAEQAVAEYDGGLRVPNHAPLPPADSPDYGRLGFLLDGGAPDGNEAGAPSGLYVVGIDNRWSHVESNSKVYNVLDYGARTDDGFFPHNGAAIQAAINAAAAGAQESLAAHPGGSIIYFPPGEYVVKTGLLIPRLGPAGGNKSLLLRGAGMGATQITGQDLAEGVPVIDFDNSGYSAVGYEFSDMTVVRTNQGHGIRHYASSAGGQRLQLAHFRNLRVAVPYNSIDYNALDIHQAQTSTFENVTASGGHASFFLSNSSACTITNYQQGNNVGSITLGRIGLWIRGGGLHTLSGIRIENAEYADLLLHETKHTVVDTLSTEGKIEKFHVMISGSPTPPPGDPTAGYAHDIILRNMTFGDPCVGTACTGCAGLPPPCDDAADTARYGLHINPYSRHIRVQSAFVRGWSGNPGNPIYVGAAEDILIENLTFFHGIGWDSQLDGAPGAVLNIEPTAKNVRVSLADGLPGHAVFGSSEPWERRVNNLGTLPGSAPRDPRVGYVFGYAVVRMGSSSDGPVCRLVQGTRRNFAPFLDAMPSEGRTLTVIGTAGGGAICSAGAAGCSCPETPNVKLVDAQQWNGNDPGKTIQFIYDGTYWREVSRSCTAATCP